MYRRGWIYITLFITTYILYAEEKRDVRPIYQTIVSQTERDYITQREDGKRSNSPRIAVCCSGGGGRAMFAATGCLQGIEKEGLLSDVSYVTGLSGSTWPLLIWLLMQGNPSDVCNHLVEQIVDFKPDRIFHKLSVLLPYLISQSIYYHRPSLIDMYGAFLADALLHNVNDKMPLRITTHDLQPSPEQHPYIICSTVVPQRDEQYVQAEISPYEVGGQGLMYYTDISNFGSKFREGYITSPRPAPTIGYLMGMLGSVMSASIKEIIDAYLRDPEDRSFRFLPAKMPNFTRDIPDAPFRDRKKLTFVDAGLDMNLPLPPLLAAGRDVDVIIICDASSSVAEASELQKAAEWAQAHGKPLPPIDWQRAGSEVCSIFESDNPYTPTIIYLPRIKNNAYNPNFDPDEHMGWGEALNTFHITYTQEEAQHITGLFDFAIRDNIDRIDAAIARKAQINTAK